MRTPAHTPSPERQQELARGPNGLRVLASIALLTLLVVVAGIAVYASWTADRSGRAVPVAVQSSATVAPVPSATAIAVSCQQAEQAVEKYHTVFWNTLSSLVAELSTDCDPSAQVRSGDGTTADQPVEVTWIYKGTQHDAEYMVSPEGAVTPNNATAQKVDEAAKLSGTGALYLLHSLL